MGAKPYISAYALFDIHEKIPPGFESICGNCAKKVAKCAYKPDLRDSTIITKVAGKHGKTTTRKKTVFICNRFFRRK
jgi:hypothetical protein